MNFIRKEEMRHFYLTESTTSEFGVDTVTIFALSESLSEDRGAVAAQRYDSIRYGATIQEPGNDSRR